MVGAQDWCATAAASHLQAEPDAQRHLVVTAGVPASRGQPPLLQLPLPLLLLLSLLPLQQAQGAAYCVPRGLVAACGACVTAWSGEEEHWRTPVTMHCCAERGRRRRVDQCLHSRGCQEAPEEPCWLLPPVPPFLPPLPPLPRGACRGTGKSCARAWVACTSVQQQTLGQHGTLQH